MQTDNSTAAGLANDTLQQRKSKAMEMRYFWIKDKCDNDIFDVYWNHGKTNRADYYSKQHPTKVHREQRPLIMVTTYENNHTSFLEAARLQEETLNKSTSKEGGKGVLISESGLQSHSVSFSHHSLAQRILAQADPHGELDRLSTQSKVVNSTHKLCSSTF